MPVNFSTPDPGINERPYVQQVPLEALFKNLGYKQAKYDQGVQQAKQKVDMLNNIASYGQDTEVKHEMFRKLNQELEKFAGANYGDAAINAQLDGLVNSFTMTNDIASMQARAYTLDKMEKEEEAARLKGQEYYNPGLNQARKYYQSGVYKKDVRFSDEGNIAPDYAKISKDILEMPNVSYETETLTPDGHIYKTKVVNAKAAANAYKMMAQNDPKLAKYLRHRFEEAHEGTDWKEAGVEHYYTKAELAQQTALEYARAIEAEKAKAKPDQATILAYQTQMGNQRSLAEQYLNVARDPNLVGEDYHRVLYAEHLEDQADRFGKSKELMVTTDISTDAMALSNLQSRNALSNQMIMAQVNAAIEGAMALGYSAQDLARDGKKRQEAMLKTEELKNARAYNTAVGKLTAKANVAKLAGHLDDPKVLDTQFLTSGGLTLRKSEWNALVGISSPTKRVAIKKENIPTLMAVIKSDPAIFSVLSAEEINNMSESSFEINDDGELEYKTPYFQYDKVIPRHFFQAAINATSNSIDEDAQVAGAEASPINYDPSDSTTTFNFK